MEFSTLATHYGSTPPHHTPDPLLSIDTASTPLEMHTLEVGSPIDSIKRHFSLARARKSLLTKLHTNRHVARLFADRETWALVCVLSRLLSAYYGTRVADKVMRSLGKVVTALTLRGGAWRGPDGYSEERSDLWARAEEKLRCLVLTVQSFHLVIDWEGRWRGVGRVSNFQISKNLKPFPPLQITPLPTPPVLKRVELTETSS